MRLKNFLLVSICGLLIPAFGMAELPQKLTVEAGKFDRHHAVVPMMISAANGAYTLTGEDGSKIILQVKDSQGGFILEDLKAGASRTYRIGNPADAALEMTAISVRKNETQLKFKNAGGEILQYNGDKTPLPQGIEPIYQRGGYIHPVYTPSGRLLTDDYAPDHKHHHGIWSPWTKTEYEGRHPDFWNMGTGTGRVDFETLGEFFGGQIFGGFSANHKFIDMKAIPEKTALTEAWDVRVYRPMTGKTPYYIFDVTTTQNAVDSPLTLPKYHYGGMGFRGRREWTGKDGMTFLTSEGKDRVTGNETRGRWCWMGGKADGETIGITIMDHPANFRSPQPMRLNPDQPFFCYSPSQLGEWKIEKGKPYVARYRFVAADGPADVEEINRLWNDYAEPPKVIVE